MPASEAVAADAALLTAIVREAGQLAQEMARKGVRRWTKPDGSDVSEADIRVDALLKERLTAARPHYGWLSEETPDTPDRLAHEQLWIADPVDGTRAFIEGRDDWCVGAALAAGGRPVVAAVYQPATDDMFTAVAGNGAYLNGERLSVSDGADLSGAHIAGNRRALSALADAGVKPSRAGQLPLLLRLAHVAAGRADGAVSLGQRNDWDLAAGELLVLEAGGLVSTTSGEGYVYNRPAPWQQGLVAAGAKRHAALIRQLGNP